MRWVFLEQTDVNLHSDSWIIAHQIGKCTFTYIGLSSFKGNSFFWKCNMEFCEFSFVKVRWKVCERTRGEVCPQKEPTSASANNKNCGEVWDSVGNWWIYKLGFVKIAMRLENAKEFFLHFCLKQKQKQKRQSFFWPGVVHWKIRLREMLVFRSEKKLPKWKTASYVKPKELFTENQSCWGLLAVKICWNLRLTLIFLNLIPISYQSYVKEIKQCRDFTACQLLPDRK